MNKYKCFCLAFFFIAFAFYFNNYRSIQIKANVCRKYFFG